jgi:hypothetical protein
VNCLAHATTRSEASPAFLEKLVPSEPHLFNVGRVVKVFVGGQGGEERLVENLISAGRIGDRRYYFFEPGSGSAPERILAAEHPDDNRIAVYDYHEGYWGLSVDYGMLAYGDFVWPACARTKLPRH